MKICLIMFNMSTQYDYDHGIVNRNFYVMRELAKDTRIEKIVAVDFLPIGLKKTIKHYWQNILFEIKTAEMVYGDPTSACYQKTDKIFTYTTVDSFYSLNKVAKELKRVEKILNLKNIVFWSYNPLFTQFINKLNEKLFVFDTVDNWSEHESYIKLLNKRKILQNYKKIATLADIIFTVSQELQDFYKKMDRLDDVYWIPNGVDLNLFQKNDQTAKTPLDKINKPIIGYLGTLQERIDIDLLEYIAVNHPDKVLALCGPVWDSVKKEIGSKLNRLDNVIFTGRVPANEAPSYINKFDVAIIPHKINDFIKSTNPMKMYEYLACAKPIVAAPGAGIDMFKDNVYVADNMALFSGLINKALSEDSEVKRQSRLKAVETHSWQNRVEQMTDIVFEKLKVK